MITKRHLNSGSYLMCQIKTNRHVIMFFKIPLITKISVDQDTAVFWMLVLVILS